MTGKESFSEAKWQSLAGSIAITQNKLNLALAQTDNTNIFHHQVVEELHQQFDRHFGEPSGRPQICHSQP
jgi:hypothetical protein